MTANEKIYADKQREGFRIALASPMEKTPPFRGLTHAMLYIKPKSGTILDVGCGTGGYAALIDRLWPQLTYTGCDISELMIDYAREDYGDRFFVSDALDLVYGADIILASSIIEVCPNWREVLAHLLQLPFQWLVLSRVRVWHDDEHPNVEEEYMCGYGVPAFRVIHNEPELTKLIWEGGGILKFCYAYQVEPETALLTMVVEKDGDA
jgi:SAM-dependent methyltransferase